MRIGYLRDTILVSCVAFAYFAFVLFCGFGAIEPVGGWKFVQYIIIAPLVEEIIFRGFLQKFINDKLTAGLCCLTVGNIIVSAVFAFLHLAVSLNFYSLFVFVPSLIFGLVYDRNSSVVPCVIVHAIFNLNIFIAYRLDILVKLFGLG